MLVVARQTARKIGTPIAMAPLRRSMRAQIIKDAQSSSNIQSTGHDIEPQSKTSKTKLVTAENISSSKRTIDSPQ